VGGVDFSDQNKQLVAQVLNENPSNQIPMQNFGSEVGCVLPDVIPVPGGTGETAAEFNPNSGASRQVAAVAFMIGLVALIS
jgi:hypothetical protein